MFLIFHRPLCLFILWWLISVWNYSYLCKLRLDIFCKLLKIFIKLGEVLCQDDEMISILLSYFDPFYFWTKFNVQQRMYPFGTERSKKEKKKLFLEFLVVNNEILFFYSFSCLKGLAQMTSIKNGNYRFSCITKYS